jgi:hypothetical protein
MTAYQKSQAVRPGSLKVWRYLHTRLKIADVPSVMVMEARAGTGLAGFTQKVGFEPIYYIFNYAKLSITLLYDKF